MPKSKKKTSKKNTKPSNITLSKQCFVFLCNNNTQNDCVKRFRCALPRSSHNNTITSRIQEGTVVLLWNFQSKKALFPCFAQGGCANTKPTDQFDKQWPLQVAVDISFAKWHDFRGKKNKMKSGWIEMDKVCPGFYDLALQVGKSAKPPGKLKQTTKKREINQTESHIRNMRVAELHSQLSSLGLSLAGRKQCLIDRLSCAIVPPAPRAIKPLVPPLLTSSSSSPTKAKQYEQRYVTQTKTQNKTQNKTKNKTKNKTQNKTETVKLEETDILYAIRILNEPNGSSLKAIKTAVQQNLKRPISKSQRKKIRPTLNSMFSRGLLKKVKYGKFKVVRCDPNPRFRNASPVPSLSRSRSRSRSRSFRRRSRSPRREGVQGEGERERFRRRRSWSRSPPPRPLSPRVPGRGYHSFRQTSRSRSPRERRYRQDYQSRSRSPQYRRRSLSPLPPPPPLSPPRFRDQHERRRSASPSPPPRSSHDRSPLPPPSPHRRSLAPPKQQKQTSHKSNRWEALANSALEIATKQHQDELLRSFLEDTSGESPYQQCSTSSSAGLSASSLPPPAPEVFEEVVETATTSCSTSSSTVSSASSQLPPAHNSHQPPPPHSINPNHVVWAQYQQDRAMWEQQNYQAWQQHHNSYTVPSRFHHRSDLPPQTMHSYQQPTTESFGPTAYQRVTNERLVNELRPVDILEDISEFE